MGENGMPRTNRMTPLDTYFNAHRELLAKQSEFLTGVFPHMGERGRNDEEILRSFLQRVLPRRYSIGTGFIISSNSKNSVKVQSKQTDVVVYDDCINIPIHRELAASVFPIEIVYASIEVTGSLTKKKITDSIESIAAIRRMAKTKTYSLYGATPVGPSSDNRWNVAIRDFQRPLPPRSYILAYDTSMNIDAVRSHMTKTLCATKNSHLHGLVVLSKDWFLQQLAPGKGKSVAIQPFEGNALLRFLQHLLVAMGSMPMYPMAIDRYFGADATDSSTNTE